MSTDGQAPETYNRLILCFANIVTRAIFFNSALLPSVINNNPVYVTSKTNDGIFFYKIQYEIPDLTYKQIDFYYQIISTINTISSMLVRWYQPINE